MRVSSRNQTKFLFGHLCTCSSQPALDRSSGLPEFSQSSACAITDWALLLATEYADAALLLATESADAALLLTEDAVACADFESYPADVALAYAAREASDAMWRNLTFKKREPNSQAERRTSARGRL